MATGGRWRLWHTFILLIVLPVGIGLAGWFLETRWAWLVTIGILLLSVLVVGWAITRLARGLFVDERNKVSLSRFQAVLWTVLVLAGYLAAALANIRDGVADPLSIAIPEELWIVIGISATSLVGSPLIKSVKESKRADPAQAAATFHQMGKLEPAARPQPEGRLLKNPETQQRLAVGQMAHNAIPQESSWSDMFRGEETSNAANLDLGKVQMFYFTLILVLAYGVALGQVLAGDGPFGEFPTLDEGMIALLGISHAAYLSNKAVPRTQEPPVQTPSAAPLR
jgi:hypothetical protein